MNALLSLLIQSMLRLFVVKTDMKDAKWIADLFKHDLVAGSFMPPLRYQTPSGSDVLPFQTNPFQVWREEPAAKLSHGLQHSVGERCLGHIQQKFSENSG